MSNQVIITAALTGAGTPKTLNQNLPVTPSEIAEDAYRCWKAGAAVVHLHMRDDEGRGTMDREKFKETIRLIRAYKDCDVVINCTSSGATRRLEPEERMEHFETIPDIEIGSFDSGSINWGCNAIFDNSPQFLEQLAACYKRNNVLPEIEIFDLGMLGNAKYYKKVGVLPATAYFQCVLGVLGGMDATVENLLTLVRNMPEGSKWSAFGIGAGHLPILFASLALGCTGVRVGLEDNLIMGKNEKGEKILATNVSLVERAANAICAYGKRPATPAEARSILGLPQLDR